MQIRTAATLLVLLTLAYVSSSAALADEPVNKLRSSASPEGTSSGNQKPKQSTQAKPQQSAAKKARTSGPQWIWSSAHKKNEVPAGDCYFRRSLKLLDPEEGEVRITADNKFQLFVNGQPVGTGTDWRQIQVFDITKHLQKGKNSIAVQVTNIDEGSAGLAARVVIKERSGTFRDYSTNESWKTSVRRFRNWTSPSFPESEWVPAASYGALGATLPWGNEMVVEGDDGRFEVPEGFRVERLMTDEMVGSLIAMTFDAQGNIFASREGDGLYHIVDRNRDGTLDQVKLYCDKIKNTQGILSLGSRVFAVGDGPRA